MRHEIKGLLADITIRIPRSRIVLVKDDYYLTNDENQRIHVRLEDIEMLIAEGYLDRNSIGGVSPTSKAIDESDNFIEKKQVPGHHGKMVEVCSYPHSYS